HEHKGHALAFVHRHEDLARRLRCLFATSRGLRAYCVAIELIRIHDVALAPRVHGLTLHRAALIADDVGNDLVDPCTHLRAFFKLREAPMYDNEHFLTHVIDVLQRHTLSTCQAPNKREMLLVHFFEIQKLARTQDGRTSLARTLRRDCTRLT